MRHKADFCSAPRDACVFAQRQYYRGHIASRNNIKPGLVLSWMISICNYTRNIPTVYIISNCTHSSCKKILILFFYFLSMLLQHLWADGNLLHLYISLNSFIKTKINQEGTLLCKIMCKSHTFVTNLCPEKRKRSLQTAIHLVTFNLYPAANYK